MFVRNCWYVAGWDHEVRRLATRRRVLLGEPVVLYRTTDGRPVALADRCPHRHAPLSQGRLRGDRIQCAYHGLVFAPDGTCVHVPSQDRVPERLRVRSYPVVERYRCVWIWMGDPEAADESAIPDFSVLSDPGWRWRGDTLAVEGSYMLVVENLMDLSHLPTLHRSTLADSAIPADEIPVEYVTGEQEIRVDRWVLDTPPPPYFRLLAGFAEDDRVDRWMNTVFTPPSTVRIEIGAAPAGTGAREGERSQAATTWNLNAITPETGATCHYFWAQAQDFGAADRSVTELDYHLVYTAFQEDLAIIKGQQQNLDLDPDAPRFDLGADRAGVQARRMVERLAAAESNAAGG